MKKTYINPCTIVAEAQAHNMLAASPTVTPGIGGESTGGEGLTKEDNWGDIWE